MPFRLQLAALLALVGPALAGTNQAIVVSAPRLDNLDLMAVDTAADVTVIDRTQIEQSGAASVPELLRSEANLLVRGTSGTPYDGAISMRGFGENAQSRNLVLVDGHKINRPDLGGIEWTQVPLSQIDRVEVIRGGQNVLYGNHALSGVVKITTKRAEESGVSAKASFGSFAYRSESLALEQVFDAMDMRVGIDHFSTDGYRSNSTTRAIVGHATVGWYPNDTDTVTIRGSLGKSYQQFPGPLDEEEFNSDPTQASRSGKGDGTSEDWSALASVIYETERDWGAARISSGFNRREREASLQKTYTDNDQTGMSLGPRIRYGSEDAFVMGGIDLNYDRLDVERYWNQERTVTQSWAELERISFAPYLFAQRSFRRENTLNGGVRYEHASTDNLNVQYDTNQLDPFWAGGIPNPFYKNPPDIDLKRSFDDRISKSGWAAELSLARRFSEAMRGWVGYDRVYRYPSLDEVASYQGYSLANPLNYNLEPETGDNVETGITFENRQWRISTTGFALFMDDEIAYDPLLLLNRNLNETRRIGVDAEAAWQREGYGASTRWSLVDARFSGGANEGNRVPLVPLVHGMFSVWVELTEGIRLTGTYQYVGEQYRGNDDANTMEKMDPYGLIGFGMNAEVGDHVTMVVSVDNLLDETYAETIYGAAYYPGAGRSFRVGMEVEL